LAINPANSKEKNAAQLGSLEFEGRLIPVNGVVFGRLLRFFCPGLLFPGDAGLVAALDPATFLVFIYLPLNLLWGPSP
jgi:hypothetical protein